MYLKLAFKLKSVFLLLSIVLCFPAFSVFSSSNEIEPESVKEATIGALLITESVSIANMSDKEAAASLFVEGNRLLVSAAGKRYFEKFDYIPFSSTHTEVVKSEEAKAIFKLFKQKQKKTEIENFLILVMNASGPLNHTREVVEKEIKGLDLKKIQDLGAGFSDSERIEKMEGTNGIELLNKFLNQPRNSEPVNLGQSSARSIKPEKQNNVSSNSLQATSTSTSTSSIASNSNQSIAVSNISTASQASVISSTAAIESGGPQIIFDSGLELMTENIDLHSSTGVLGTQTSIKIAEEMVLIRNDIGSNGVARKLLYDYAPDVIVDKGKYRMYWCGGVAGDYILHAEAPTPLGPFKARKGSDKFDMVFHGTKSKMPSAPKPSEREKMSIDRYFDSQHTCDPNVAKFGDTYYLYYGGGSLDYKGLGAIGVATSSDGITFTRANQGKPIVSPSLRNPSPPISARGTMYGVGQPAVTQVGQWYYMSFTDTTGEPKSGSNPDTHYNNVTGASQYLIRAKDPLFQTQVEDLTGPGQWTPRQGNSPRHKGRYAYIQSVSVDMAYDAFTKNLIIFSNQGRRLEDGSRQKTTLIYAFDLNGNNLSKTRGLAPMYYDGPYNDGPGIAKYPNHHLLPRPRCKNVEYKIYKSNSYQEPSNPTVPYGYWDLSASVVQYQLNDSLCPNEKTNNISIVDGSIIVSSGLPLALYKGGLRIQLQSKELVKILSAGKKPIRLSSVEYHSIPFGGSIFTGQPAIHAEGQPIAFASDTGLKFPISCAKILNANGSQSQEVSEVQYNILGVGPSLTCP